MTAILGEKAADNRAHDDSDEGRALNQGIPGGQFGGRQMVRQDAVFHGAEQGRNHAEQEQREQQQRNELQREPENCNEGRPDFGEFQLSRHLGLVEAVGHFAAEGRQDQEWRDENRPRRRYQCLAIRPGDLEQDQENNRILENIVAECREELRPEQGRKSLGRE